MKTKWNKGDDIHYLYLGCGCPCVLWGFSIWCSASILIFKWLLSGRCLLCSFRQEILTEIIIRGWFLGWTLYYMFRRRNRRSAINKCTIFFCLFLHPFIIKCTLSFCFFLHPFLIWLWMQFVWCRWRYLAIHGRIFPFWLWWFWNIFRSCVYKRKDPFVEYHMVIHNIISITERAEHSIKQQQHGLKSYLYHQNLLFVFYFDWKHNQFCGS